MTVLGTDSSFDRVLSMLKEFGLAPSSRAGVSVVSGEYAVINDQDLRTRVASAALLAEQTAGSMFTVYWGAFRKPLVQLVIEQCGPIPSLSHRRGRDGYRRGRS